MVAARVAIQAESPASGPAQVLVEDAGFVRAGHLSGAGRQWRTRLVFAGAGQLLDGQAEVFGTAMAVKRAYTFTACKVAVFTWHGCVLQMTGQAQHVYVADETPMVSYLNLHHALEKLRGQAQVSGQSGPRVRPSSSPFGRARLPRSTDGAFLDPGRRWLAHTRTRARRAHQPS